MSGIVAKRAADFISSIGVNIHLERTTSPYGKESVVEAEMLYLGVHHARALTPASNNIVAYKSLAELGIKFDLTFNNTDLASELAAADQIAGAVSSIEGPNEVDFVPVTYQGTTGPSAAVAFQKALYAGVKADPLLGHAAVLPFSVANNLTSIATYGNVSAYADYGNIHSYGSFGVPPYWWMSQILTTTDAPGRPIVITETGNYTLLDGGSGVNEDVQAKWLVDTLLDAFKNGVAQTYIYQLLDPDHDNSTINPEAHWGLFNLDGTAKPAAVAFHNLTTILADPGANASTFTPGTLGYSVSGLSANWGFNALLAKSTGAFDIQLWQEPQLWNEVTRTENVITPSSVTLSFQGVMFSVQVFDPFTGTAPIATYSNVNALTLLLGSDALIVEVTPTGTPTATTLPGAPQIAGLSYGTDSGVSAADGITANTHPTLYGHALAGALVTLAEDGRVLGTAVADATGLWALTLAQPLADGRHMVTAVASTSAGHSGPSAAYAVTIDDVAPTVAAIASPQNGSTLHPSQGVTFTVSLSQSVLLDTRAGTPTLALSTGGVATFDAAHSTATLWTFTTVLTGGQSAHPLQVTGLSLNGAVVTDAAGNAMAASLSSATLAAVPGDLTGVVVDPTPLAARLGSGPDSIVVNLSEYVWQGDAQVTLSVDGVQIGGVQTVTALHGAGTQAFTLAGSFGRGSHKVAVTFVNNLWQGTLDADRKLYFDSVAGGGVTHAVNQMLMFNGTLVTDSPVLWTMPAAVSIGAGPDTITVDVSENAWQGDAKFTLSVDGVQIGGTQTATAEHAAGQTQAFALHGAFGVGTHVVTIDLQNPAYGGSALLQRTLTVDSIAAGGVTATPGTVLTSTLASSSYVALPAAAILPVALGTGPDSIKVGISEDAFMGSAQFTLSVDGVQIGGTQTASALHGAGQSQIYTLSGSFGHGSHKVTVQFLNAAFDATHARKLYLDSVGGGGVTQAVGKAMQFAGGLAVDSPVLSTMPEAVSIGAGADTITVDVSENAWQGDAKFTLSVDGVQIGGTQTATAEHAAGQTQAFALHGAFGVGTHVVTIDLQNPAYGGSALLQRTLTVDSIAAGGVTATPGTVLTSTLASSSYVALPAAAVLPVALGSGPDSIKVGISEDAFMGSAQFSLSVDGVQVGGTQTAAALHGAGQSQVYTLSGSFGPGSHVVRASFLNPAQDASGKARALYVDSVTGSSTSTPGAMLRMGAQSFATTLNGASLTAVTVGAGTDSITLNVSEDAYLGNAQFAVYVDGVQIGGTQTTTAQHALGQSQSFTLKGAFGSGQHFLNVAYLNDLNGGAPQLDRNLYVDSVTVGGSTRAIGTKMATTGFATVVIPAAAASPATTPLVAAALAGTFGGGTVNTGRPTFLPAPAPLDAGSGATPLVLTGGPGPTAFILHAGANGDSIVGFSASAGDVLDLKGYGPGAALTQVDATTWLASGGSGRVHDLIHLGPALLSGHYQFLS